MNFFLRRTFFPDWLILKLMGVDVRLGLLVDHRPLIEHMLPQDVLLDHLLGMRICLVDLGAYHLGELTALCLDLRGLEIEIDVFAAGIKHGQVSFAEGLLFFNSAFVWPFEI